MNQNTILYSILALTAAFALAYFQYIYKKEKGKSHSYLFFGLRFLSTALVLFLIINPKFKQTSFYTEKPNLIVAVDNSNSIAYLEQRAILQEALAKIKASALDNKFEITYYQFDDEVRLLDSLSFKGKQSNLDKTFKAFRDLKKNSIAPIVVLTDGNQTFGTDYTFSAKSTQQAIFPVILGDSLPKTDLSVQNVIVNQYAYLGNQFPIEVTLGYSGNDPVSQKMMIQRNGKTVFSKRISFSNEASIQLIRTNLKAEQVGVNNYSIVLESLVNEQNTDNNNSRFAIEVIDETTNVLIVSEIAHPDIGMLKNSINSNIQRKTRIKKPEAVSDLNDDQLIVLYQPQRSFKKVYELLERFEKNYLTITGTKTDWAFLNAMESDFEKQVSGVEQAYGAGFNSAFSVFQIDDLGFNDFPPLDDAFGALMINSSYKTILNQKINGFYTENPLFVLLEQSNRKKAVLFGENIWRWRAQSFLRSGSFQDFDAFLGKTIQYLSSNKKKNRLVVDHESFYYGTTSVRLSAQYFDKNYEFDPEALLSIALIEKNSDTKTEFPLVLKNSFYEVDLSSLAPGNYEFTVSVSGRMIQRTGAFQIIPYNVEEQFLNADVTKLSKIATNSGGQAYFADQVGMLINNLAANTTYTPIQKVKTETNALIDWKYLLIALISLLGIEWFIRKYKGLI
jgi:hypothetical protein